MTFTDQDMARLINVVDEALAWLDQALRIAENSVQLVESDVTLFEGIAADPAGGQLAEPMRQQLAGLPEYRTNLATLREALAGARREYVALAAAWPKRQVQ